MNDFDKKIQNALQREQGPEPLGAEPNLAEEIITAFRGRYRALTTLLIVINLLAFAGVLWTAVQFYHATEVTAQLRWGGGTLLLLLVAGLLKLWFWLELQTNRVLREVKRLELLLLEKQPR